MSRFAGRLIFAATAEYLCHRLDPSWKLRRAQRRLHERLEAVLTQAHEPVNELARAIHSMAGSFRDWYVEHEGNTVTFREASGE